jgi:non-canonical purine NTP pyrophosphatase (RdgB/HAM1 family)
MEILIASKNIGKIREIESIFDITDLKLLSLTDIDTKIPEIKETGSSYFENALIKAKQVSKLTGKNTLADDSGLEIDYLNLEPGVRSARFPKPESTDEQRCIHVLSLLEGVPEHRRNAKFVCVMVLYMNNGIVYSVREECKGRISESIRGKNGFGYDPIFMPSEYDYTCTFGEVSSKMKNKTSHRYNALSKMKRILHDFFKLG